VVAIYCVVREIGGERFVAIVKEALGSSFLPAAAALFLECYWFYYLLSAGRTRASARGRSQGRYASWKKLRDPRERERDGNDRYI